MYRTIRLLAMEIVKEYNKYIRKMDDSDNVFHVIGNV